MCSIDTLMRPDLIVGLPHIDDNASVGILSIGVKCYSSNLPKDDFVDNLLSTDLHRAFINVDGQSFGTEADREHITQFNLRFSGPRLRLSFVYGGVVGSVDLAKRMWTNAADNSVCVHLDHTDREGLSELLSSTTLVTALDIATGNRPVCLNS